MRTVRAFVPALGPAFGASLLFTLSGPGEKIAFHPAAGSSLERSYLIEGDFSLDELSVVVDGQDMGAALASFEMSMEQETRIEVTDVFVALSEGRPSKLERTFGALSSSLKMTMSGPMQEGGDQDFKSASPLEGQTVVFQWNEEKGEFDLHFSEDDGEAELLEGLVEDMDLRAFLPDAEVAKDDTWSVPLEELSVLYMPGGDLSLKPEGLDLDEEGMEMMKQIFSDFGEDFSELIEGECTCTFAGSREEEGVRLAEITVAIEAASTFDLTEMIAKILESAVQSSGVEMPNISLDTADLNLDFDGGGTLLWDLEAGRLHSFQLQGDVTIDLDLAVSLEVEGESHALDASFEMSGSMSEEYGTKE